MGAKVILVCTTGRTGSTWLGRLLNRRGIVDFGEALSHPGVGRNLRDMGLLDGALLVSDDGVFWDGSSPLRMARRVQSLVDWALPQPCAFKLFGHVDAALDARGCGADDLLVGCDVRRVVLGRDAVDIAVSQYVVSLVKMWHVYDEADEAEYSRRAAAASYDFDMLMEIYESHRGLMDYWHERLRGVPYLDVRYEELVRDAEGTCERILRYVGHSFKAPFGLDAPLRPGDPLTEELKSRFIRDLITRQKEEKNGNEGIVAQGAAE